MGRRGSTIESAQGVGAFVEMSTLLQETQIGRPPGLPAGRTGLPWVEMARRPRPFRDAAEACMTVRPIIPFPDARLTTPAAPVARFDATLAALADDLLETMRDAPGIGITGPHIGVMQAITVIALTPDSEPRVFVNPVITDRSADLIRHTEGSVSMPGVTEDVERPGRIRLRYQGLDGAWHTEEATDLMAICLQHEIDQINGIFWIQRLSRLKRDRLVKRYEKGRRSR